MLKLSHLLYLSRIARSNEQLHQGAYDKYGKEYECLEACREFQAAVEELEELNEPSMFLAINNDKITFKFAEEEHDDEREEK